MKNVSEFYIWGTLTAIMTTLSVVALLSRRYLLYHTARIYNWNGKRYCFIGRCRLRKENDIYVINIRERLADLSCTTSYQFCLSGGFVRKNRYRHLKVQAGKTALFLPIEERMRGLLYSRFSF